MKYYLAIDIGASSGRHIIGWREGSEIKTKEVYRFPNGVTKQDGHLVWDIECLYYSVLAGIREAFRLYPEIESLSIDTWGVDYILLDGDKEIYPVYAYRDGRTETTVPRVHEIIPFSELYSKVGCQFQPFNSIYQLYDDKLPICTETGLTDGKKCSVCGEILVQQEVVPANGHKDEDKNFECDVCFADLCTEHVPADGVEENRIEATCTTKGSYDLVVKCAQCGEEISREAKEIAELTHSEELVAGKDATCTEAGLTEGKKCSVCGETLVAQEEIPMANHTEEVVAGKAATCTEAGLTEGKKCSVCGKVTVEQEEISAGHTIVDGICTGCGYIPNVFAGKQFVASSDTAANMYSASFGYARELNSDKNLKLIYDYIINNVNSKNIAHVFNLGDIVQTTYEYEPTSSATDKAKMDKEAEFAYKQIARLDGVVDYSLIRGNHDGPIFYEEYFGVNSTYTGYSSHIEDYYINSTNSVHFFSAGNLDYMVVTLDFGAGDSVVAWANEVIAAHPNHNVIIVTHAYLHRDGNLLANNTLCARKPDGTNDPLYNTAMGATANNGDDLWNKLVKKHANIVLVLSGHVGTDDVVCRQLTGDNGNIVTNILIDPQDMDTRYKSSGGVGAVAMFYFSNGGKTVEVRYYSTVQGAYIKSENQYTFTINTIPKQ